MWAFVKRVRWVALAAIVFAVTAAVLIINHHPMPLSSVGSNQIPASSVTTVTPNKSDMPCPVPSTTPTATTTPSKTIPMVTMATPKDLTITISEAEGTAGHIYYNMAFKNITDGTVSLYGFPGVSVLDTNGHEIGVPAQRMTGDVEDVINIPGGSYAYALLRVTDAGALTNKIENSSIARIYVPDTTTPVFVPFKVEAPTTNVVFMTVSPINAGSSG
jgi:hypothetical protein